MTQKNILIVEDSAIVGMQIKFLLNEMKYNVTGIARTGEDALMKAGETGLDLVLMDIKLSGKLDGIETAKLLKEKYDIPVIYLTAYSDEDTLRRAKESDPFGYLLKPFETRELITTIEIALYKHSAEKKLRKSDELHKAILKAIPDSLLKITECGIVSCMRLNEKERLFFQVEEFEGQNVGDLFSAETTVMLLEKIRRAIQSRTVQTCELTRAVDGILHIYEWRITAVDSQETLVMIRDITKQKFAQQELEKAKQMAEDSDKLKSEFLAQVSHEIRTPLNAILSFSSLLKDELENTVTNGLKESFSIIDRAGKRLIRTIEEILEMSQIRTGNYEINPSGFDLVQDVLDCLLTDFHLLAREKGLSLLLRSELKEAGIIADKRMINQIFFNLVDNAVKYTMKGSIEILCYKDSQGKTCVDIKDTGIGIAPEYLPRLFTPFSQEEMGYTRRYEGNGLGLAIARKYAELNRAEIDVISEKGKGTVFTVSFCSEG
ncbi:MAG: ATP-binding protein [Ignavibacteriales bacterium]